MGLSGATISAPLGCRGLRRGAVGGGKARKAEAERWRRAGWSRRVGGPKVRCVATEKHDETAAVGAAVGVEFADEEDYRKGGGGELLYVQMQATKPMESQSKIASKVGTVTAICVTCFLIRCVVVALSAFDAGVSLEVLDHPILDFFYYMFAEILPSALVLFVLRKLPPKRVSAQYHPIN